jgi:hypothetical protein
MDGDTRGGKDGRSHAPPPSDVCMCSSLLRQSAGPLRSLRWTRARGVRGAVIGSTVGSGGRGDIMCVRSSAPLDDGS